MDWERGIKAIISAASIWKAWFILRSCITHTSTACSITLKIQFVYGYSILKQKHSSFLTQEMLHRKFFWSFWGLTEVCIPLHTPLSFSAMLSVTLPPDFCSYIPVINHWSITFKRLLIPLKSREPCKLTFHLYRKIIFVKQGFF